MGEVPSSLSYSEGQERRRHGRGHAQGLLEWDGLSSVTFGRASGKVF